MARGLNGFATYPSHPAARALASSPEAIQAIGASLRYLPKYSPDLNPIELVFHPLKTFLRKAAQRTIEGLHRSVGSYIRALDPSECMGYFRHGL
jgi:transposase